MLDRREIRENPDAVKDAVRKKGIDLDVDELLDLDRAARKLQHDLDQAQARRDAAARQRAAVPLTDAPARALPCRQILRFAERLSPTLS